MFLSILKIIGIVFLVIVALLILILGIILLVPIRYQFAVEYNVSSQADILIKWFPILLKVTANYRDDKFEYMVRMFGGVVVTNMDVPLSWLGRKLSVASDDELDYDDDPEDELDVAVFSYRKKEDVPNRAYIDNTKDVAVANEKKSIDSMETHKDNYSEKSLKGADETIQEDKSTQNKKSILDKIRQKLYNIKAKIRQWIDKLKRLNDKREALMKVYHSKRFDVAKKDIIAYIKQLWSIIRPKKMEGYIHFGLEDPAVTGQTLGVLAMFLVWYDDFLEIQPDFEKASLDGYLNGKGRFRLFSIVKLLIKIIFNKNLIKVIKKVQNIIEA